MSAAPSLRPDEAEIVCGHCTTVFRVAVPRNASLPGFCGDKCRNAKRRERERSRGRVRTPAQTLAARARCHEWAEAHRGVKSRNPWLAGPPPFDAYLPGGFMTIGTSPRPTRSIRLQDTRGLHGALTAVLDQDHERHIPNFSLVPGEPWGVYWWREEGLRLAGREVNGTLWDRPTVFRFGPLWRLKAPLIEKRGRQSFRIDTITPVVSRCYGSKVYRTAPTNDVMQSMLGASFAHRLGLSYLVSQDLVRVKMLESRTENRRTDCGSHLGTVVGWEGHVIVEVNAPAAWLLRAAERVGLGGRSGFGFGRIRVTPC